MSDGPTSTTRVVDCPLPLAQQRWNSLCYGLYWFLFYLAAPVTYVGVTHANLVRGLGFSPAWANLPGACYQWCMAAPILIAWFFPQPRLIKPLFVGALSLMGLISAAVGAALFLQASPRWILWLVIAFGAVFGTCNGTLVTLLWEIVRRGTSSNLRGRTMGLAFGLGPLFACAGSVIQQLLMGRDPLTGYSLNVPFPHNYACLFGGAAPLIWLAALLGSTFILPPAEPAPADRPTAVGWHSLREFFGFRPVLFAAIAYLLVYSGGNAIFANVSLYAPEALGIAQSTQPPAAGEAEPPPPEQGESDPPPVDQSPPPQEAARAVASAPGGAQSPQIPATPDTDGNSRAEPAPERSQPDTQGLQNLLRFGFKSLIGLALGVLLSRRGPRAALIATTSLLLLGMAWALGVAGWWYLLVSGLLGAGELFGAYFPNYVATASSKRAVRANMALLNLLSSGVGFASVLFGWLAATWGLRSSFYAAAGLLVMALILVVVALPDRPLPLDDQPPVGDPR